MRIQEGLTAALIAYLKWIIDIDQVAEQYVIASQFILVIIVCFQKQGHSIFYRGREKAAESD